MPFPWLLCRKRAPFMRGSGRAEPSQAVRSFVLFLLLPPSGRCCSPRPSSGHTGPFSVPPFPLHSPSSPRMRATNSSSSRNQQQQQQKQQPQQQQKQESGTLPAACQKLGPSVGSLGAACPAEPGAKMQRCPAVSLSREKVLVGRCHVPPLLGGLLARLCCERGWLIGHPHYQNRHRRGRKPP